MAKRIAIFYHGVFMLKPDFVLPAAMPIILGQMETLRAGGLLDAADYFVAGINGGVESASRAKLAIPAKAKKVMHGLDSNSENLTIVELENWIRGLDRHEDWNVLYFHSKGATHAIGDYRTPWRDCMMKHLVANWRQCVFDLETYESVGCHWMAPPLTPKGQHIWAGNFWWARASFLSTLPSIFERDRIKQSGIASLESRYESEVWIGNGPRLPTIKDYHPNWDTSKINTCK